MRILLASLIVAGLISACLATPTSVNTPLPPAPASLPPSPVAPSPVLPTVTATPSATATPLPPALAVPIEYADNNAGRLARVQNALPSFLITRVADSAEAIRLLQQRQITSAVIAGPNPFSAAQMLCLTPYVPIVHFSSMLDAMTTGRLAAIYQGKDWTGPVYYAANGAPLARILGIGAIAGNVVMLSSWDAVIERVAADRTALAFVPWSAVDARVKTLPLDGDSIAQNGLRRYAHGDSWWLVGGMAAAPSPFAAIAQELTCPSSETVTLMATGDILMGWYVHEAYIKPQGPLYPFRRVRDLLRSADITFADFENPMPVGGPVDATAFVFGADPGAAIGLADAGIDVVNLANNHMGDFGGDAISNTLSVLRNSGIGWVGAGRNRTEAHEPWITSTKGMQIAILGYNEIPPDAYVAGDASPGTAWIDPDTMVGEIKQAKAKAGFVVVALHMGTEYTAHPTERQQELARRAAEAGASLVIGDHPHVVQALGFIGKSFVIYSLGDFVYVQPGSPATGEAAILRAVIDGPTLKQIDVIPVYIDRAQPYVTSALEAKLMTARIFDATRRIDGLPPLREQPAPSPSAAYPVGAAQPTEHEPLAAVLLDGPRANVVRLWRTTAAGTPVGSVATPVPTKAPPEIPYSYLTTDGLLNDAPVFSPDGTRLAYSSARNGNIEIYVAAAGGSNAVNITNSAAWDDYPTWSPDGRRIAFSSNRGGPYKIYIMNADGTGLRQVTDGGSWDTTPAWSPDGKRIAFASDRAWRFQIFTVNVDGSDLRQVTGHPHSSIFPAWSPDAQFLAFQTYRDQSVFENNDANQDRDYELFVSRADGSGIRQLTDNRAADVRPAWSPAGRQIAFASDRNGSLQIYVLDVATGDVAQVTQTPGSFSAPRWMP